MNLEERVKEKIFEIVVQLYYEEMHPINYLEVSAMEIANRKEKAIDEYLGRNQPAGYIPILHAKVDKATYILKNELLPLFPQSLSEDIEARGTFPVIDKSIRFNFKCGCFIMAFMGQDQNMKGNLSCCIKHEHPYAKTKEYYLTEKEEPKLLSEEELERVLPRKYDIYKIEHGAIVSNTWKEEGYNLAIDDCKKAISTHFHKPSLDLDILEQKLQDAGFDHVQAREVRSIIVNLFKPSLNMKELIYILYSRDALGQRIHELSPEHIAQAIYKA